MLNILSIMSELKNYSYRKEVKEHEEKIYRNYLSGHFVN